MDTKSTAGSKKSWLEKWQTWVGFAVGVLTLIGLIVEVPQRIMEMLGPRAVTQTQEEDIVLEQPLAGTVRDEANDPLSGVRVTMPKYGLTATSDKDGIFRFRVKAPKQESVHIMAQKEGYETVDDYATVGRTNVPITMERQQ